jgi:hypothetical protein
VGISAGIVPHRRSLVKLVLSKPNFGLPSLHPKIPFPAPGLHGNIAWEMILTGTPANSRPMAVDDLIEVEVSQLGRLGNRVVEGPAPRATVGHQPTDSEAVRRVALGSDERLPQQLAKSA